MSDSKLCPNCHAPLTSRALVDSDERVYEKWKICESCGFDSRKENALRPLNAADQSAIDSGCNCSRKLPYFDSSHARTCPLYIAPTCRKDYP